jgi:hypothetical protein
MGGGAGHMNHPFDLQGVNTGNDLLDFFETAKGMLEKKAGGAVKIDGVNVSFKVTDQDDVKQMAVDRGSLAMIDIEGITASRVNKRFKEGHGMRVAITTLLQILNGSIEDIQPELEALGMWDDPTKFLNTEYVEGTTNVTQYDTNFLAIHGLNQFYEKTAKSGPSKGNYRPGLERPMIWDAKKKKEVPLPDPSREISYDPEVMERLVEKLKPLAEKYGFQVYSSVPTERSEVDIDYSEVLSEPFTVRISDDTEITKSIGEWLNEASNPRYKVVTLQDEFPDLGLKRKTHALHKNLYLAILHQALPITELIDDADAEAAIYGAVFMHATRVLGNQVLRGLTSPMGDLSGHEGAVLRDEKKFGPKPVKITGEFIVGNMGGGFGQVNEQEDDEESAIELNIVDSAAADVNPAAAAGKKIALVPGAFKPPHRGHLAMVEEYAVNNEEVKVLISNPLKRQRTLADGTVITAAHAKRMWESLAAHLPNVSIEISTAASPLTAAYEFMGDVGPLQPGDVLTLGASEKCDDWKRWSEAEKYIRDGVELLDPRSVACAAAQHGPEYMALLEESPLAEEMPSVKNPDPEVDPRDFHASDMRYLLGKATEDEEALELLEDFIGGEGDVYDFLSILGIDTGLNEPLEEMSMASAGAAGGHSNEDEQNSGGKKKDDPLVMRTLGFTPGKRDTKKKKQNENIDMSLVMDVYKLLIERGIKT